MNRSTLHAPGNERPRLIVIIPIIVICLGSIVLLFLSKRPAQRQSAAPQDQALPADAETNMEPGFSVANRRSMSPIVKRPTASLARQRTPLSSTEAAPPIPPPLPLLTAGTDAGPAAGSGPVGGPLPIARGIEIRGRVTLEGTPPKEIRIDMTSDPQCDRLHTTPVTTRHYLVDAEAGLSDVLVYVKGGLNGPFSAPASEPLLN